MFRNIDIHGLVSDLNNLVGSGPRGVFEPQFSQSDEAIMSQVLESSFVSPGSVFTDNLESMLASITGSAFVFATNTGTAALHLALLAAGVSREDEVIVPALTFVGTANAVSYCGAKPNFIDISSTNLTLCPERLERFLRNGTTFTGGRIRNKTNSRPISGVIAVHAFAHAAALNEIKSICNYYELPLIEDAAAGLGSRYYGSHLGTIGDIGIISFNGNKLVTGGAGGAVLTSNINLFEEVKTLGDTARERIGIDFSHSRIAYNYRMPGINAALILNQIKRLDDFLSLKNTLHQKYRRLIGHHDRLELLEAFPHCQSNYWLETIKFPDDSVDAKNEFLAMGLEQSLGVRPLWKPLPLFEFYADCFSSDIPNALNAYQTMVNLPSSWVLGLK
ncbi:DegT/DnrJ/EryC1/StrS family aminotransferase [Litorivicinus sp.]|nr:DegT/DnrJ/EryC1/StrS family aminotransferase [Litorivicinus sp.]